MSLAERLLQQCEAGSKEVEFAERSLDYAVRHKQVILDFSRFPARNAILKRESTAEEIEFIKNHPVGF